MEFCHLELERSDCNTCKEVAALHSDHYNIATGSISRGLTVEKLTYQSHTADTVCKASLVPRPSLFNVARKKAGITCKVGREGLGMKLV